MAKKKSTGNTRAKGKSKAAKQTPSARKAGAGARATARSAGGRRKTAGAKTPQGKARRKQATNPPRPGKRKAAAKSAQQNQRKGNRPQEKRRGTTAKTAAKRGEGGGTKKTGRSSGGSSPRRSSGAESAGRARGSSGAQGRAKAGGSGRESTLDQTPETGRTVRGRTNPMPTRRSTGTAAGAGSTRQAPDLDRSRKQLRELEESIPGPPSSLDMDRNASAARSGRRHMQDALEEHTETSPALTGGDVDANWEDAYAVGDEAPGGDNPTPDQDRVDDIGKALGVVYEDNEELKAADKIAERDKHRWELDPASSDDYKERE